MGIVGEHTMTTTAAIARSARIGEAYKSALARAAAHLSRQYGRAVAPAADAGESYEDALARAAARRLDWFLTQVVKPRGSGRFTISLFKTAERWMLNRRRSRISSEVYSPKDSPVRP